MGTPNYGFTYIDPKSDIDIEGNTTRFLNEIDSAMETCSFSLHNKNVAFLGDSITYGQKTAAGGQVDITWPRQFGNVTGCNVFNYAVGGSTAATYQQAPSNALAQAQSINESFDYIFMMFGTNDYGYKVQPGTTDNQVEGSSTKGIIDAVTNIMQRYPNTRVIGVIPPYMPGDFVANDIGFTALDYKSAIYQAYTIMNVPVIDLTHGMGYNSHNWNYHLMTWDIGLTNLHPNQETYIEIGNYVAKSLSANSFGGYVFNRRSKTASIPTTFGQGAKAAGAQPPIAWKDKFTGNLHVDFGDGILISSGFTGKLFELVQSEIREFPYHAFYGTGALLDNSDFSTTAAIIDVETNGTVNTIGNIQPGKTLYGNIIVPACYFPNS